MKEVLNLVISELVENKESIVIEEKVEEKSISYTVKVASSDIGKIIGKQGRIAKAIRILMKAIGTTEKKRVNIQFMD